MAAVAGAVGQAIWQVVAVRGVAGAQDAGRADVVAVQQGELAAPHGCTTAGARVTVAESCLELGDGLPVRVAVAARGRMSWSRHVA
jgi:hypothetical protein